MTSSYVIFPSLEEKIQESGLLKDFPALGEELYGDMQVDNGELNSIFRNVSQKIKVEIGSLWNIGIQANTNWVQNGNVILPSTNTDLLLLSGELLGETGISQKELFKPCDYGFQSPADMILSLSAYRLSIEGYEGVTQVHTWVTANIKTVLGFGGNGETKLFQSDESIGTVVSPFGNELLFKPRSISKINEVYNGEELRLFAIILRFAKEVGVLSQILQDNDIPLETLIRQKVQELGDSGEDDYSFSLSHGDAANFVQTPLGDKTHGIPCMYYEHISYFFERHGDTLCIKTISQGSHDGREFIIKIADCKHLLYGLFLSFTNIQKRPDILLHLIQLVKED